MTSSLNICWECYRGETGLTRILSSLRFNADEFLSIDQLPPPKKTPAKPEPEPERPKPSAIRQVGIADQIAIRSYVLAKSAGKPGE